MDQALGLRREPGRVPRDAVVVARTQRNDQVGVVHDPVGDVESVHAKQSVVAWVRGGNRGLAWNRVDHRAWHDVQKFLQLALGAGQHQTIAHNNNRPLRGIEMGDHVVQFSVQGVINRSPVAIESTGSRSARYASRSTGDCWASFVRSISTGPGRPARARWNASRTTPGISSGWLT